MVKHQGKARRFVIRGPADPVLRLFAFYANCEHEVRPVTEGYRVVLSFELRFRRVGKTIQAPEQPALTRALQQCFALCDGRSIEKLVYLLDHDYSQRSLGWSRLKGVDHGRAEALQRVGEALGLQVHLALITVTEMWNVAADTRGYYEDWRGGRYWHDEDEDEDSDTAEEAAPEYELTDLIERAASLAHWRDSSDQNARLPELLASDEELCCSVGLERSEPAFEQYEGYMGNYGDTVDREYRRSAVVLWPAHERYRILARAGGEAGGVMAFEELEQDAAELDAATLDSAVCSILDIWPGWQRSEDSALLGRALRLSSILNKPDTATELLRSFALVALKPSLINDLLILGQRHGAGFCQSLFAHWSGAIPATSAHELRVRKNGVSRTGRGFDRNVDHHRLSWLPHFASFCRRVKALDDDAWLDLPESLFDTLLALLVQSHASHHAQLSRRVRQETEKRELSDLVSLLKAAKEIGNGRLGPVIDLLTQDLDHYGSGVLVGVLEHLEGGVFSAKTLKNIEAFRSLSRQAILARINKANRAKNDWTIDAVPACDCIDCQSLGRFLQSNERAIDLPLAKQRPKHLRGCITTLEVAVSHSTRRQGSPHVLELRKLNKLFKESSREHARELAFAERVMLQ